jgi:serine/threonine-protein phosphatase 2A regulatory subunit A
MAEDLLRSMFQVKEWRVRFMVITNITKIGEIFGKGHLKQHMKQYLLDSLVDTNIEIKILSLNWLYQCCEILDAEEINNQIIPCFNTLTSDNEPVVRVALAKNLCLICPLIGKKATNDHLLSIVLNLLRDENIEVKTALLENLNGLAMTTNMVSLGQAFYPVLIDMSTNTNWRVKENSMKFILFLVDQGGAEVFNQESLDIRKFIGNYLLDDFFSVRNCAIEAVRKICENFGESWFGNNIMPLIDRMELSRNYKVRVSYIHLSKELIKVTSGPVLKILVQRVLTLCGDPVPNVKINSAKA